MENLVKVNAGGHSLEGDLQIPEGATGIVLFVHGSGSSRHSPRNRLVAKVLQEGGIATLLIDLLTTEEERQDALTGELRFDIDFLAGRVLEMTDWLLKQPATKGLKIGYFGASTGAAAALVAASAKPVLIQAVVSRGGRPDLAKPILPKVQAATLLIVGGADYPVIEMNREAYEALLCEKKMVIVPQATHLFEEPGTLEEVARLARDWFRNHLSGHSVR